MAFFLGSSGYLRGSLRQQPVVSGTGSEGVGNGSFAGSGGAVNDDQLGDVEVSASQPQIPSLNILQTSSFSYPNIFDLVPEGFHLVNFYVYMVSAGGTGGPGSVSEGITTTGGGGGSGSIAFGGIPLVDDYTSIPVTITIDGDQAIVQVQGVNTTNMTVQSATVTTYPGQNGSPDGIAGGVGGLLPTVVGSGPGPDQWFVTRLIAGQDGGEGVSFLSGFGVIGAGAVSAGQPINDAPTQAGPGVIPGYGGGSAGGFNTPTSIPGGAPAVVLTIQYSKQ